MHAIQEPSFIKITIPMFNSFQMRLLIFLEQDLEEKIRVNIPFHIRNIPNRAINKQFNAM